jgi:hypothetical protein
MAGFPAAPNKTPIPSFAAYPIGYEAIRRALEPHLPREEFHFGYFGLDSRLAKDPDFSPIEIFRLDYSPDKWRENHWSFYARGALRKDKSSIREAMQTGGFESLIEFLTRQREPIWAQLAFGRSLLWDSPARTLSCKDHTQIEGHKAERILVSLPPLREAE